MMEHKNCGGMVFELQTGTLFCMNCGELDSTEVENGHIRNDNHRDNISADNIGKDVRENQVEDLDGG